MSNLQIVCDVVLGEDGSVDVKATSAKFQDLLVNLKARREEDHDRVAVDVTAFLLENPGLRTIATPSLVRGVHGRRLASGDFEGKSHAEIEAAYSRLEEIIPEYVRANPDMFHVGKKT